VTDRVGFHFAQVTASEVVLAGEENACGHNPDAWLARIRTSDGTLLWSATHNGAQNYRDNGMGGAQTSAGWVLVAQTDIGVPGGTTNTSWIGQYDANAMPGTSATLADKQVSDMAETSLGPVVASMKGAGAAGQIAVTAFDTSLAQRWDITYAPNAKQFPNAMVADAQDNVYVGGYGAPLLKLDSTGAQVWTRDFSPSTDPTGITSLLDIAIQTDGTLVLAGSTAGNTTDTAHNGTWLRTCSPAGDMGASHAVTADGSCSGIDAIAVDPRNNDVLVACLASPTPYVVRVAQDGTERSRSSVPSGSLFDVAVGPDGTTYAAIEVSSGGYVYHFAP
jgi:hypothetical protein